METMSTECYYYQVLWRKFTKKKNKTFDFDGVLVQDGIQCTLYDESGAQIAKNRVSSVGKFSDGCPITMNGKEIEVQNEIPAKDFLTGKCFVGAARAVENNASEVNKPRFKPFVNSKFVKLQSVQPSKDNETTSAKYQPVRPRHDPSADGAVVLARPPEQSCNDKYQIVDVVIDPVLSKNLRDYQKEGVRFMYECVMGMKQGVTGAILADEMGLGKTLQTICLVQTLLKQTPFYGQSPIAKRVLIVCPATLVKNWQKEFKKWLGDERIKVFVADGGSQQSTKAEDLVKDFVIGERIYPVMITNYEKLRSIGQYLDKKVQFDLIVADEASRLKSASIQTTKSLLSLKCKRKVLLTGTPIQNDLTEFYNMCDIVHPNCFGSVKTFKSVYQDVIMRGRLKTASKEDRDLGLARSEELSNLTSQFILRRTAEVNADNLPPKIEATVFCQMSQLQISLYERIIKQVQSKFQKFCQDGQHLNAINLMKQISNSPEIAYNLAMTNSIAENVDLKDYEESTFGRAIIEEVQSSIQQATQSGVRRTNDCVQFSSDCSGKLNVLKKLLLSIWQMQNEAKVVIVSHYTQTLDVIQSLVQSMNVDFFRLDGSTNVSKRMNFVDRFNDIDCKVKLFLLSAKSGGFGLNLVAASRLVMFDCDWNPTIDAQAMARVWRSGQRAPCVYIYRLLGTGSIDEKIFQRGVWKDGLSNQIMNNDTHQGQSADHFSTEDLRRIFRFNGKSDCETHDLMQCRCQSSDRSAEPPQKKAKISTDEKKLYANQVHTTPSQVLNMEQDVVDQALLNMIKDSPDDCNDITFLMLRYENHSKNQATPNENDN
ncbi:hypothetical protein MP228_000446 [Amoeboaphelidium protococcarum]|nr:hypothetical protein MP228_000446 [Amoeboaphelidium protococcarum]